MTESIAPPATGAQRSTRELAKVAASGWLGTALEFMDFQLYSLAAASDARRSSSSPSP